MFSQPVNLVAGETLSVIVGKGGQGFAPVSNGSYYVQPAGDDGLGGYPGGSSMLVSPSLGTLLECDGGSGAAFDGVDDYSGPLVPGLVNGAQTGGGTHAFPSPNRIASGAYVTPSGPGACGPAQYGVGNKGSVNFSIAPGNRSGGMTPFGYGSGADIFISGCYISMTQIGICIGSANGRDGVVFIDVLY